MVNFHFQNYMYYPPAYKWSAALIVLCVQVRTIFLHLEETALVGATFVRNPKTTPTNFLRISIIPKAASLWMSVSTFATSNPSAMVYIYSRLEPLVRSVPA